MDSDYSLLRAAFCLSLVFGHINTKTPWPAKVIPDNSRRLQNLLELWTWLSSQQNVQEPSESWRHIKNKSRGNHLKPQKEWTPSTSVALLDARRFHQSRAICSEMRRSLRSPPAETLRNDPMDWWIEKCKEMEKAEAFANSLNLYRVLGNTGRRRWRFREAIRNKMANGFTLRTVGWRFGLKANQ